MDKFLNLQNDKILANFVFHKPEPPVPQSVIDQVIAEIKKDQIKDPTKLTHSDIRRYLRKIHDKKDSPIKK